LTKIVAHLTGFEHEFVKVSNEEKEEYKKNTYSLGVFPYLKDESSGEGLGESLAIARFMCNSKVESGLYGSSSYETACIDEVVEKHLFAHNQILSKIVPSIFGYGAVSEDVSKEVNKKLKDYVRTLDEQLKDKEYFVGGKLTLADVYVAVSLNILFATVLDSGFRKAVPNLMKWYENVRNQEVFLNVLGKPRYCGKAFKPKIAQ